jgi:hypothetical protein
MADCSNAQFIHLSVNNHILDFPICLCLLISLLTAIDPHEWVLRTSFIQSLAWLLNVLRPSTLDTTIHIRNHLAAMDAFHSLYLLLPLSFLIALASKQSECLGKKGAAIAKI